MAPEAKREAYERLRRGPGGQRGPGQRGKDKRKQEQGEERKKVGAKPASALKGTRQTTVCQTTLTWDTVDGGEQVISSWSWSSELVRTQEN